MHPPLILAGDQVVSPSGAAPAERPRQDYEEITRRLGGNLHTASGHNSRWYPWLRRLNDVTRLDLISAYQAINQSSNHSLLLSMSEKLAIPIALVSYVSRMPIPHVVIAHKLSSGYKTHLFNALPIYRRFDHVISLCRAQATYATETLGLAPEQVDFTYDKVDHHFFYPLSEETEGYILAVGKEKRDYQTLLRAVAGADIPLVIRAGSNWEKMQTLPEVSGQVTIMQQRLSYLALRRLYARARLVVIPLQAVNYAAGVNAVLEAMAMAKPLIVTRSPGIVDYVAPGETGRFVPPGAAAPLRNAILSLWHDKKKRQRLGDNARQAVETKMNLDLYATRVVEIVQKATQVNSNSHSPPSSPNSIR